MSEYLILMSSSPRLLVDPPGEPLPARGARKHTARLRFLTYVATMSCTLRGRQVQVKKLRAEDLTPGGASGAVAAESRRRATIPSGPRPVASCPPSNGTGQCWSGSPSRKRG